MILLPHMTRWTEQAPAGMGAYFEVRSDFEKRLRAWYRGVWKQLTIDEQEVATYYLDYLRDGTFDLGLDMLSAHAVLIKERMNHA